jgi:hypothetical protein
MCCVNSRNILRSSAIFFFPNYLRPFILYFFNRFARNAVIVGWLTTREHVFPAWVGWVFMVQGLLNFITGLFNIGAQGRVFPILVPILQTVATFAYGYFIYQLQ